MRTNKSHILCLIVALFLVGCESIGDINSIKKETLQDTAKENQTLKIPELLHPSERESGRIYGWGDHVALDYIPEGDDFVEVAAGMYSSNGFALKSDGTPVLIGDDGWGDRGFDQHIWQDEHNCDEPEHNHKPRYLAVTPHLGLRDDSTLVSWYGEFQVSQSSGFVAVSGYTALHEDGSVSVLGMPSDGFSIPVKNDYVAISQGGGGTYILLLDKNGVVYIYGDDYGEGHAIPDNVLSEQGKKYRAIASGLHHQVAIDNEGRLETWGNNDEGQLNHPDSDGWQQVSAGHTHSVALRIDGTLIAWGAKDNNQVIDFPTEADFIMVSAGNNYSLAIR